MKCKSGQHEWVSPVNATRCCNPAWRRVVVPESAADTLDINGRIFGGVTLTVSGWVPVAPTKLQGDSDPLSA
jgi:hypothetical protein